MRCSGMGLIARFARTLSTGAIDVGQDVGSTSEQQLGNVVKGVQSDGGSSDSDLEVRLAAAKDPDPDPVTGDLLAIAFGYRNRADLG